MCDLYNLVKFITMCVNAIFGLEIKSEISTSFSEKLFRDLDEKIKITVITVPSVMIIIMLFLSILRCILNKYKIQTKDITAV